MALPDQVVEFPSIISGAIISHAVRGVFIDGKSIDTHYRSRLRTFYIFRNAPPVYSQSGKSRWMYSGKESGDPPMLSEGIDSGRRIIVSRDINRLPRGTRRRLAGNDSRSLRSLWHPSLWLAGFRFPMSRCDIAIGKRGKSGKWSRTLLPGSLSRIRNVTRLQCGGDSIARCSRNRGIARWKRDDRLIDIDVNNPT
jgi:hypothetical protein